MDGSVRKIPNAAHHILMNHITGCLNYYNRNFTDASVVCKIKNFPDRRSKLFGQSERPLMLRTII